MAAWIVAASLGKSVISPSNAYLSAAKSVILAPSSHAVGPRGLTVTDGQPASPSAGYGSAPWSPWWWQCGSEKLAQKPAP